MLTNKAVRQDGQAAPSGKGQKAQHNIAAIRDALKRFEDQIIAKLSGPAPFFGRVELTLFVKDDTITGGEMTPRETWVYPPAA